MLQKLFKLSENKTNVKTEITAGVTTFVAVAYIIALNPNLLTNFGAEGQGLWNAVFMATCISSAVGMFCMAFFANKPFAMGPGMGRNTYLVVVVGNIVGMTGLSYLEAFQASMLVILLEGILFTCITLLPIREKIINAIPEGIRLAISPAIGLMLLDIGLGSNAGLYSETGGPFYAMRDFFGALTPAVAADRMGSAYPQMVLSVITMFVGLFAIVALTKRGVKGAVLLGILLASLVSWAGQWFWLGENPFASLQGASFLPPVGDWAEYTLFKFNVEGFLSLGWIMIVTLVITFSIIDLFDTIGTMVGTASQSGMLDEKGNMPQMKQAMLSAGAATVVGACTGTSTITTFVESASGVEAGGRTGLTALVTGTAFLVCIFLAPVAAMIPPAATSAALIYVGVLMLMSLKYLKFDDLEQMVPAAIMMIGMPISGSIGHAIGLALIVHTVLQVLNGKAKKVPLLTYILSLLFVVKFFLAV